MARYAPWSTFAVLLLPLLLLGCGDSTGPEDVTEVRVLNTTFAPPDITIEAGTTVRWINHNHGTHILIPTGHSQWTEGRVFQRHETFEHTFNTPGVYEYTCQEHSGQDGIVRVE